jgi:hypothetical protein
VVALPAYPPNPTGGSTARLKQQLATLHRVAANAVGRPGGKGGGGSRPNKPENQPGGNRGVPGGTEGTRGDTFVCFGPRRLLISSAQTNASFHIDDLRMSVQSRGNETFHSSATYARSFNRGGAPHERLYVTGVELALTTRVYAAALQVG